MDELDLLEELDNADNLGQDLVSESSKSKDNTNTESWWDKTDIQPQKPLTDQFKKSGKSFSVYGIYEGKEVLPDTVVEKFVKLSTVLSNKGYVFRHSGSNTNNLQNKLLEIPNINTESYLPFPAFNKNIKKPKHRYPEPISYQIAMHFVKNFTNLKPGLRAIISSRFNSSLGNGCLDPVDVMILYNRKGLETTGKDVDYIDSGDIPRIIYLCRECGIPYFNIGNDDSLNKLIDFIKNLS